MNKEIIIDSTRQHIQQLLSGEGSGHDWWHIVRVTNTALTIAELENADLFVVELAALLHDIADWKFNAGDDNAGPKAARKWLESQVVPEKIIKHVCHIIKDLSFKGAGVQSAMKTVEGMVVQDADRLDAVGAIGIARTFAYGGHTGREMCNPTIKPVDHASFDSYKKGDGPTINHFYEKLLLLKDRMNTSAAKEIAEGRHVYMEQFLERFYKEWEGEA